MIIKLLLSTKFKTIICIHVVLQQYLGKTDKVTTVEWEGKSISLTGIELQCLSQHCKGTDIRQCWLNDKVSIKSYYHLMTVIL